MRSLLAIALSGALFLAATGHASALSDRTEWDFSAKTGVTMGKIRRAESSTKKEFSTSYAGIPLALSLNQDMLRSLSLNVEIHLVSDYLNVQVTETGLHLGIAYHLLGGSRRTTNDLGYAQFVYRDRYNVSLLLRFAYSHYNASPRDNPDQDPDKEINGSAFETMFGIQYRQDISDTSAITLEAFMTMSSLPASADERVSTARNEFLISYRFFL